MIDYTALYAKMLANKCTQEEIKLLFEHFATNEGDADLVKWVEEVMDRPINPILTSVDEDHLRKTESSLMKIIEPTSGVFSLRWVYGAAAALIAIMSVWFYIENSADEPVTYANDVQPGKNGATLTLANGRKVLINDMTSGSVARQAGVKITKTADGQVIYESNDQQVYVRGYHTLSTSSGEQLQVRLMDGTKVFLNSGSSLQYPASFSGEDKRVVTLKGEAYFEVFKDAMHPFVVETRQQKISVLGTHFNVHAYEDENTTRTTLAEGSVSVAMKNGGKSISDIHAVRLDPGNLAVTNGENLRIQIADLETELSWKEGYFRFNDDQIETIMKKISRWYDIDVVYQGKIPAEGFTGTISKKSNISQVLAMLQGTKIVHFKVEGRRVTVLN